MQIYRVNLFTEEDGYVVSWHATKAEAEKRLREWQIEYYEANEAASVLDSIELVDIPTDEAGLLNWLNTHFITANE